jgi:hypothetical protein
MSVEHGARLTGENTNAWGHRLCGDTLVVECPDCEFGEVPLAAMIEEESAACPDCGSRFEALVRRVG